MNQMRWVCPYCFDDHAKDAACDQAHLKDQIDFLRTQIELANMQAEQRGNPPFGWLCTGCRQREKEDDGSRS